MGARRLWRYRVEGPAAGRLGVEHVLQHAALLREGDSTTGPRRWAAECGVYVFPGATHEGVKQGTAQVLLLALPEDPEHFYAVPRDGSSVARLDQHAHTLFGGLAGVRRRATAVLEAWAEDIGGTTVHMGRVTVKSQAGVKGLFCELEARGTSDIAASRDGLEDFMDCLQSACAAPNTGMVPQPEGAAFEALGNSYSFKHLALQRAALLAQVL